MPSLPLLSARLALTGLGALLAAGALPSVAHTQAAPFRAESRSTELVVVLHGMGRTPRSMSPLVEALEKDGFDVLNLSYSSYCCSIGEIADTIRVAVAKARLPRHETVHFVGHSLGGIVIRTLLTQGERPPGAARVVTLASPNQGSRVADRLGGVAGLVLEPVNELRTDSTATVRRLPPIAGVEIGVLAADDDWAVTEEETHVVGEADHRVVNAGHTFIMRRAEVHRLTIAFLRTGRFAGADSTSARRPR